MEEPQEEFSPHGPYEVPVIKRVGGARIEKEQVDKFWKNKRAKIHSEDNGCYIFYLEVTNGTMPVYVGKTTKTFRKECFASHKLDLINSALTDYKNRYTPHIIFLIPKKRKGKTNRKTMRAIDELESYLISIAKKRNSKLRNKYKGNPEKWAIKGMNIPADTAGQPKKGLKSLKDVLWL